MSALNPPTAPPPAHPPTKSQIEQAKPKPRVTPGLTGDMPATLRNLKQWVAWQYHRVGGRWTKVPIHRAPGADRWERAKSTDPVTWMEFEDVELHVNLWDHLGRDGAGFVVTRGDDIVVIDLDDCRNRDTGELTAEALRVVNLFDTYTEVSPSGTGLKLFLLGKKPGDRCKETRRHIEVYEHSRFVAVTGKRLDGTPDDLQPRQEQLDAFYRELFPADEPGHAERVAFPCDRADPVPRHAIPLSDQEVLDLASNARNGAKFDRLWHGDPSGYDSGSEADFALAGMLAFYAGPDVERVVGLMRMSGLRRAKWDENKGYLPRTVRNALRGRSCYYEPKPIPTFVCERVTPMLAKPDALKPLADLISRICAEHSAAPADPYREERDAAEANYRARRDADRYPCHCTRFVVLERTEVKEPWLAEVRCEKRRDCPACTDWLNERELVNARLRFHSVDGLWERYCDPTDWPALHRRLRRAGGEYLRCWDEGRWWVAASVPMPNAAAVDATQAVLTLRTLLETWDGRSRPVRTSNAWSLPKQEPNEAFTRVGRASSGLTTEALWQIAESCDATPVQRIGAGAPGKLMRLWQFSRPGGWNDDLRARCYHGLYLGDMVPENIEFELPHFGPPRAPDPPDDRPPGRPPTEAEINAEIEHMMRGLCG